MEATRLDLAIRAAIAGVGMVAAPREVADIQEGMADIQEGMAMEEDAEEDRLVVTEVVVVEVMVAEEEEVVVAATRPAYSQALLFLSSFGFTRCGTQ